MPENSLPVGGGELELDVLSVPGWSLLPSPLVPVSGFTSRARVRGGRVEVRHSTLSAWGQPPKASSTRISAQLGMEGSVGRFVPGLPREALLATQKGFGLVWLCPLK